MNKIAIVIGREYTTRVKKKSFLILTILMPFLIVLMVMAPIMLGSVKDDKQRPVAIIDQTGKYIHLFVNAPDSSALQGYAFTQADRPLEQYQSEESNADAVIYISDDLTENPQAVKIYSRGEIQGDLKRYVESTLLEQTRKDKLQKYDIPALDNIIADIQSDIDIQTVKWSEDGKETYSSSEIAMVLGLLTAMMIYIFVLSYGSMVMQGVMEEKTNRIVEVIVGSVKPFDLMMGKIIGIMLVGFTQMLVWLLMLVSLLSIVGIGSMPDMTETAAMTAQQMEAMQAAQNTPLGELSAALYSLPLTEICVLFVLYFLGGYILYSSFYAAIGAAVNSQEDSSQFMMPMVIIMVFSIYAAMGSMENTDGPLAFWTSLFPLTSPIVMMVRIPFGVPLWQEILSIVLLYATATGFVWVSSRIYRVGILLYGKKPTMKDLMKWITYK